MLSKVSEPADEYSDLPENDVKLLCSWLQPDQEAVCADWVSVVYVGCGCYEEERQTANSWSRILWQGQFYFPVRQQWGHQSESSSTSSPPPPSSNITSIFNVCSQNKSTTLFDESQTDKQLVILSRVYNIDDTFMPLFKFHVLILCNKTYSWEKIALRLIYLVVIHWHKHQRNIKNKQTADHINACGALCWQEVVQSWLV